MRSRFIASAWLAALFILSPHLSWANDPELDALLLESNNLMQDGRIAEALVLLEGAEPRYSHSREFMNNLAVAYLGNSQAAKALEIFRQLVDEDPLFSIITHNLLEMELQISDSSPDQISPVLFVQSVESFFDESPAVQDEALGDELAVGMDTQQIIQDKVRLWASLWSAKDFIGYLSMYSQDFIGTNGESFSQWARSRREPLDKPGSISVLVSNFSTAIISDEEIQISFDQQYNSSDSSEFVRKQLVFTRENQDWKIIREVRLEVN